jgi:RimJ/RimL family protein N-acetyltransferase
MEVYLVCRKCGSTDVQPPSDFQLPIIRALIPPDAEAFRALRLEALATAPEAFASSCAEESAHSVEWFRSRIPTDGPNAIFGAFHGSDLVGMAGFAVSDRAKSRHKGMMWGVFVRPDWRGRGLGKALVRRVIEHAAEHVMVLQAAVVTTNDGARRVYHQLGFVPYGIERKALCVDGAFHDEELLALEFRE